MELTIEKLQEILLDHEARLIRQFKELLVKPKSIRINQKTAGELYGKPNVKNWRLTGQLTAYKMGCAIEYEVAVLDELMKQRQLIIKRK